MDFAAVDLDIDRQRSKPTDRSTTRTYDVPTIFVHAVQCKLGGHLGTSYDLVLVTTCSGLAVLRYTVNLALAGVEAIGTDASLNWNRVIGSSAGNRKQKGESQTREFHHPCEEWIRGSQRVVTPYRCPHVDWTSLCIISSCMPIQPAPFRQWEGSLTSHQASLGQNRGSHGPRFGPNLHSPA